MGEGARQARKSSGISFPSPLYIYSPSSSPFFPLFPITPSYALFYFSFLSFPSLLRMLCSTFLSSLSPHSFLCFVLLFFPFFPITPSYALFYFSFLSFPSLLFMLCSTFLSFLCVFLTFLFTSFFPFSACSYFALPFFHSLPDQTLLYLTFLSLPTKLNLCSFNNSPFL